LALNERLKAMIAKTNATAQHRAASWVLSRRDDIASHPED
jgi:hypothetical protein